MSILLADDDVNLATFLSKSLESEGYSVHTALDEGSVLAELRRQNYKLIILDLNFGATDGLKLLEKLRTRSADRNSCGSPGACNRRRTAIWWMST